MDKVMEFLPVVALTIGAVYILRMVGVTTKGGSSQGY